jgi:uracil-DNA glycosylase
MADLLPETLQPITTLAALREAEAACTLCPLFRNATQAVPGEGSASRD